MGTIDRQTSYLRFAGDTGEWTGRRLQARAALMCDRDPLGWWTRGRVTLLGDAAHPMYPVGSNGASQAILDARCLSDFLNTHSVTDALSLYEAERLPTTVAVVRSNRFGGPERVVDLVASRAPQGFERLSDVATGAELSEIVRGYAKLAGF